MLRLSFILLAASVPLGAESGPDLTGVAAVIVAVTGFLGLLLAQIAQLRKPAPTTEPSASDDVTTRVLELVEDLDRCRDRCEDLRRENLELRARIDRRSESR